MRFFLFRLPRHKQFHFVTRYYEPEQEARQQRYAKLMSHYQAKRSSEDIKASIRAFYARRHLSTNNQTKTQRLYIIAVAVSTLLFFYIGLVAYLFAAAVILSDWWRRRQSKVT